MNMPIDFGVFREKVSAEAHRDLNNVKV